MEDVNCLLCGCGERRIVLRSRDQYYPIEGEFAQVECARCGFRYLSPRPGPTDIGRYYPDEYASHQATGGVGSATWRAWAATDAGRRAELVCSHKAGGDLLDIGCASGDFLAAMQKQPGWNVRGLEPSAQAVERARCAYGLTVDEGSFDEAAYPAESFDVVTLWEVLEHLPQPLDALRRIMSWLRPGGLVIMSLPNRDSLDAKFFGPYWVGLDVPRHFSVFSRADIGRALTSAGFEKPRVFARSGYLAASENGAVCLMYCLHIWLGGDGSPGKLRQVAQFAFDRVAQQPLSVALLFLLSWPYSYVSRVMNRATRMTVIARKPS